ncbi:MAG: flavin reductase [Sphaerochaetaceae bacterium]|jgi:flavin reductase (DIM6/NTAB) family NADH-FMN oxidoreductase RutF
MFEQVDLSTLELNPFTTIGEDKFLITAGNVDQYNTMTAGWGFFGTMWNKSAFGIVVRPSRYTYEFLQNSNHFTVSFFSAEYSETLKYLGQNSGRDKDKISMTNLSPTSVGDKYITFEEANMVLCCKKASMSPIEPEHFLLDEINEHYEQGDYHTLFIGFVQRLLVQES